MTIELEKQIAELKQNTSLMNFQAQEAFKIIESLQAENQELKVFTKKEMAIGRHIHGENTKIDVENVLLKKEIRELQSKLEEAVKALEEIKAEYEQANLENLTDFARAQMICHMRHLAKEALNQLNTKETNGGSDE